ncbi:MAG: OmpA family protein [Proteobacteria bacterium]|nr:OmpA family protein [Pseudomonadota bacterium]
MPAPGFAQESLRGFSTDIDLIRPNFGYRSIQGLQLPGANVRGTVRWGLVAQYSRNPLTLYDFQEEIGAVIANRTDFALGASIDISKAVSAGLVVPGAWNSGVHPDAAAFAANGAGLGDIGASVRVTALHLRMLHLGAHGGLILPTGRRNIYIGEQYVRGVVGLMAMLDMGPLTIGTDAAVTLRGKVDTEADFVHGPELNWNSGLRFGIPYTPLAVTSTLMLRGGFSNFMQGGAENGIEAMGGLQYKPVDFMRIDVSAGRGFTTGYGTSDFRLLTGFIFEHVPHKPPPPPPPPPPVRVETVVVEEIPEPPPLPPLEPAWEEGELARVVGEEIKIREKLQFIVNTPDLLADSKPVLNAIAAVVNENALIGHVVIEGHASEEGSYEFNYELSLNRARTIFEELIQAGVHPKRLSYRGMGEVVPTARGMQLKGSVPDETILAINRRVEFHIIRQFEPTDELPEYSTSIKLPWSGSDSTVKQPPKPELPEPEEEEEPEGTGFDDWGDDELEMKDDTGEEPAEEEEKGGKKNRPDKPKDDIKDFSPDEEEFEFEGNE